MAKFNKIILRKIELLFVFIILFIFHLDLFVNNCNVYKSLNFDVQALFVWNYTAIKGFLPFRDVFYPYGLFNYFSDTNHFIYLLYHLLFLVIFLLFFEIFRKLFQKKIVAYLLFFAFVVFVDRFIGVDTFIRYGSAIAILSTFILSINFKENFINRNKIFIYSLISGLLFVLLNDTGIYLVSSILFATIIYPLVRQGYLILKKTEYYRCFFSQILILICGFLIGTIPLIYYLIFKNIYSYFISNFFHLSDFFYVSKIPFTPGILSAENVFTIGLLLITFVFISLKCGSLSLRKKPIFFLQVCLIFLLVLIEQKNVMRSSDKLLSFYGFYLLLIIFSDLIFLFKNHIKRIYLIISLVILFLLFGKVFSENNSYFQRIYLKSPSSCLSYNEKVFLKNKELDSLAIELKKIKVDKVFSYPADPVIYSLLGQKPPFYFSTYEASTEYGQNKIIEYLKNNKINYVIINTSINAVQDSVPDYIRVPLITRFILNNYNTVKKVGDYLILEKVDKTDFFKNNINESFSNYLLNVDLESIPISEGYYKSYRLIDKNLTQGAKNIISLNEYLIKNELNSSNKLLTVIPSKKYSRIVMKITSADLKQTSISMIGCSVNKECIIDLNNIPLFYKDRIIKKIEVDNFNGEIKIYNNSDTFFW